MTNWLIPVAFYVVFGYLIQPILIKKITTGGEGRVARLVWQYLVCAFLMLAAVSVYGYISGTGFDLFTLNLGLVILIGVFNGIACYCHWKAVAINLSVTSVSTWLDDVTAMLLGYLFLQEGHYLNGGLYAGIFLAAVSALLFSFSNSSKDLREISRKEIKTIWFWIIIYSFIWGGAMFSNRLFALRGMPIFHYMFAWYFGSLVGAGVVYFLAGEEECAGIENAKIMVKRVLPLSVCICTSLGLGYLARSIAPILVVQPIAQVSEMILPTVAGLLFFREYKVFNTIGWVALAMGFVGGMAVIFSY